MECNVLVKTEDMAREEWLEFRKKGIGGSDVGAICGINKWKSPIAVYLDKIGAMPNQEKDEVATERMYFGNVLEEVVAREFSLRTGKKVRRRNIMFQHPEHPFMLANIDREVVGERAILECKTASEYVKDEWEGDKIPESYILQVQHYLAVIGYDKAYIACLIGGNKFVWKEIKRNQEIIDYIISIEKDFWENHVLAKNPPMVDGSDDSKNVLSLLYPMAQENTLITLNNETDILIAQRNKLIDNIKDLELQQAEIENKIKAKLGEVEKGKTSTWEVKWSNRHKTSIDSKKLKADMPELFERYSKISSYRQLSFKRVN